MWSCDGHDKLSYWGFGIYACIDAYSRKVMWSYCGNANRSFFCVLAQYLRAIKALGHCPRFVRTDKGGETLLAAAAHYTLYVEALAAGVIEPDGTDQTRLECSWIWGPSWRNVRIERLWGQLGEEVTRRWASLFELIEARGFWRDNSVADRTVMLFVFMPLLRQEIHEFLLDKNEYPTRRIKGDLDHIPGVPNQLYEDDECDLGFPPHLEMLSDWEANVTLFGKYYSLPLWSLPFLGDNVDV